MRAVNAWVDRDGDGNPTVSTDLGVISGDTLLDKLVMMSKPVAERTLPLGRYVDVPASNNDDAPVLSVRRRHIASRYLTGLPDLVIDIDDKAGNVRCLLVHQLFWADVPNEDSNLYLLQELR